MKADAKGDKGDSKADNKPAAKAEGKTSPANGTGTGKTDSKAKVGNPFADELLADLGSSNATHKPTAKVTQAGAKEGVAGGAATGTKAANGEYIAQVVARIRPHVQVPEALSGNPKAVVEVTLLPSLEVRDVKLLQSSGNAAYDEAVQRAVWMAKTFPPLPAGVAFGDYRRLKLEFRPK